MRISTLRICISTIIPFLSIASTYADTEIIPSPDPQCNQYFDAGYVYEGDNGKELFDVVRNIGSNELDLYQDEQISPIIDTSGLTAVSYTIPEFRYATDFLANCGGNWCVGGTSGRQFSYLTSGQAFKWLETIPGKHLQVVSIDKSKVNDTNRAQIRDKYFKIKYTIKGHFWSDATSSFVGDFNHVECQQIGAHFCGDGVVEPGRETCDPAAPGQSPATCDIYTCQPIITTPAPVVSIKKYAKEISAVGDTQIAPISIARGEAFNYYYQLQNTGSVAATYVVVKDTLPSYLTFSGAITVKNPAGADVTADWACTKGSQVFPGETIARITLVCIKATPLPAYSGIYTFTVPVVLATNAPVDINMQNIVYACADNMPGNPTGPNGEVICGNINPPPPPPPGQCTPTNNPQKDPACIVVRPPVCTVNCGGGGVSHVGPKCVNSIKSCATYNSLIACEAELGTGKCFAADAVGQSSCQAITLSCGGPGGPGGGGRCGDGVLQPNLGEECDVVGASWCDASCKIDLKTNPGANPITDLWMTIPVLAGTQRLGYTWLDGIPGKVAFSDNRMVLGVGTKAFTLADSVGFGIRTQYRIPLMIEANKKICLKSEGSALNSEEICTTFGALAPNSMIWTRIDGTRYVVIGQGDFQSRKSDGTYERMVANSPNNVTLFRGPVQYSSLQNSNLGPTLNSAFFGMATGNNSTIGLFTDTGVDLAKLAVRVSGAVVASIGSSSNRAIESFINTRDVFADFLGTTIGYTSTTTSNNTNTTTTVALPTLVGAAGGTVSSVAELEQRYTVNGNRNILAVTGDLTITCPAGSTVFTMSGVRTVIVSGNLIIRCNIVYGSSDSISSWAWIAKNGNIQVYNGTGTPNTGAVTNLAGVYVAVKETTGGDITYTGANTTQAILRVEGTLYGNASPLFASRLYARATGAYDILTTGTILTYSNRALVSPPPLLSQYLGTYQVKRVVQ